jgi:hypothetical protein
MDLVYREWKDGPYPMGDLLPDDLANGETAATKEFEFGIGPGCTGEDGRVATVRRPTVASGSLRSPQQKEERSVAVSN